MADRVSLGILGFIFGGVTAAVMMMAATVVVAANVDGRLMFEPAAYVAANR